MEKFLKRNIFILLGVLVILAITLEFKRRLLTVLKIALILLMIGLIGIAAISIGWGLQRFQKKFRKEEIKI